MLRHFGSLSERLPSTAVSARASDETRFTVTALVAENRQSSGFISWKLLQASLVFISPVMSGLFGVLCVRRQEISTTTPAARDAAGAIRCSQRERRCTCKVSDPTCTLSRDDSGSFHTTFTLRLEVSAFFHEG